MIGSIQYFQREPEHKAVCKEILQSSRQSTALLLLFIHGKERAKKTLHKKTGISIMTYATKTRNQKASYWQYTGNHPNGKDCPHNNPYGIPMGVIAWAANSNNATYKRNTFGQTVTVSLPKYKWDQAYIEFAKHLGECLESDFGALTVRNDDGVLWAVSRHDEYVTELQERNPEETLLEAVKNCYAIVYIGGKEYLFESDSL